ncbi:MAG: transpeptidase family protein [Bacteroidales bacterium]|nr:transpeptidase family protein [Bacteroidales bacterium]
MEKINFNRLVFIFWGFLLLMIIAIGRIVYLQFIKPPEKGSNEIAYRFKDVESMRGDILATDGRPMATSVPYYEIRMDFSIIDPDTLCKYADAASDSLAALFKDKSAAEYKKMLVTERSRKKLNQYKRVSKVLIDYTDLIRLKSFPFFNKGRKYSGLIVEDYYKRIQPYGNLAKRLIGSINQENVGTGLEISCDSILKGETGLQKVQRYVGGEWIPVDDARNKKPVDGMDIRTTINIDFQEAAHKALLEQLQITEQLEGATAIVMEVETGAIRAMVNLKRNSKGEFDEIYNYAIMHPGEPGSVFKAITLTCLLEDKLVTLETPVNPGTGVWAYGKQKFHDTHYIGPCTVQKALEQSSNIVFAKLAAENYAGNPSRFVNRIKNMKVGAKYDLAIKGEARSTIHSPEEKIWSVSSLPSMAIGYSTLLTPLQTLTFYNAIAADGKMSRPYLIEEYSFKGMPVKKFSPTVLNESICSVETARTVQKALRAVVEHGTGRTIGNSMFPISGKTGTSRIANGKYGYSFGGYMKYQATFVGFFPSNAPKYSAIVVLYSGKTAGVFYGATWAGPVFKKMAEYLYSVSPQNWGAEEEHGHPGRPVLSKASEEAQETVFAELGINGGKTVPARVIGHLPATDTIMGDYTGMGLKNALYLLEKEGYVVSFSGSGRVVAQSPSPGSHVSKGAQVHLSLGNIKQKDSSGIGEIVEHLLSNKKKESE